MHICFFLQCANKEGDNDHKSNKLLLYRKADQMQQSLKK